RLRQAGSQSEIFHSQEGFLLRTSNEDAWIPVNITIARLHVQPKTLAMITARDVREHREALAQLKAKEAELRRVLASVSDGLLRWVRDNITPTPPQARGEGRDGSVRLDGVLTDLTDRKVAEEALAQERRLLQTLMNNLPDAIYFKDRESRFLAINAGLAKRH